MENTGYKPLNIPLEKDKKSGYKSFIGKIPETIGRGDDARNSIIYLTLKWSFISGVIITLLIVCNNWFFRVNEKVPDLIGDVKITWSIMVPIITLALGYAFGKSQK